MFDEDGPRWVKVGAVAALFGLLAVIGLVLALVLRDRPAGSGAQARAEAGDPKRTTGSSSSCNLPAGDQMLPVIGPVVEWVEHGGLAMPRSAALGPARDRDGRRTCFAHSPAGAVVAAMNPVDSKNANTQDLRYAGFRIDAFDDRRAELTLVFSLNAGRNAGRMFTLPAVLNWVDGDWRADDSKDVTPVVVASLKGYVLFGPGNH